MRNSILITLLLLIFTSCVIAQQLSDEEYLKRLEYSRSKLSLISKTRLIDERRRYITTDYSSSTYSWESYSTTSGNIYTSSLARDEEKEVQEWYIIKGGIRNLSDLEFLSLVGDQQEYNRISKIENAKSGFRLLGNVAIGVGLVTMIGGAGLQADQPIVTAGGLVTVAGFFISAFNQTPDHYIQPDYAQALIDQYNIRLKQKIGLPLQYDQ